MRICSESPSQGGTHGERSWNQRAIQDLGKVVEWGYGTITKTTTNRESKTTRAEPKLARTGQGSASVALSQIEELKKKTKDRLAFVKQIRLFLLHPVNSFAKDPSS
jgi:hypothetical protein